MTYGKAIAICADIENPEYTDEERGLAIHKIMSMETINAVTKDTLMKAIRWMWNQLFEWDGDDE